MTKASTLNSRNFSMDLGSFRIGRIFPSTKSSNNKATNYKVEFKVKRFILLLLLFAFLVSGTANAQTLSFTEITVGPAVSGWNLISNCQWVDYDNDGDLDIFFGGASNLGLYRNDGNDIFVKVEPFFAANSSHFVWGDYDHDEDLDLFVDNMVFTNNGDGTFTGSLIQQLKDKTIYALELGDIDNDGDLDLGCILSDKNSTGIFAKILYTTTMVLFPSLFLKFLLHTIRT
jgi:hypothetical protein